jgi:hypothetical protein
VVHSGLAQPSIWLKEDIQTSLVSTSILVCSSDGEGRHLQRHFEFLAQHLSDPSLDSAGYDLNKIIRTEYDEPLYAEMGMTLLQLIEPRD